MAGIRTRVSHVLVVVVAHIAAFASFLLEAEALEAECHGDDDHDDDEDEEDDRDGDDDDPRVGQLLQQSHKYC